MKIIKPELTQIDGGLWVMETPLIFQKTNMEIVIKPVNTDGTVHVTDLTTCPKWMDKWLNNLDTFYPYCAIFHDALLHPYSTVYVVYGQDTTQTKRIIQSDRSESDIAYYRLLKAAGANDIVAALLYTAVTFWSFFIAPVMKFYRSFKPLTAS